MRTGPSKQCSLTITSNYYGAVALRCGGPFGFIVHIFEGRLCPGSIPNEIATKGNSYREHARHEPVLL